MNTDKKTDSRAAGDEEITELVNSLASNDGMVRLHAREMLARTGKRAVEAMIKALDDPRDQVRWEAAKTLVAIGDHRAAGALVRLLYDDVFDIRWLAAEALVVLQEDALPALLAELELHPEDIQLQEGARHVLKKLRNEQVSSIVEPVLEALSELEPELTVPVAAKSVMEALQRHNNVSNL